MYRLLLCLVVALAATSQTEPALRSFDRVVLLEQKAETSASVSLGDIDGDGDLDIVLAKGRHWPLDNLVFRNDGKGHFTREVLGSAPDRTYSAALADLNGDGSLDIVVSNDNPDSKRVYLNDGKGHFRDGGTFGDPKWETRYITLADVNGDKRPDILVANRQSGREGNPSFVCLNNGKGAFPACTPLATESATIIVAADLDGDGFIDLFIPHRDGGQTRIFWNDGTGTFKEKWIPVGPAQSNVRAAAAADLNGDGLIDLVVGDEKKKTVYVYYNRGKRGFADPVALTLKPAVPYSIAIGDLNRDGKPDIVVGNSEAPGSIFFHRGIAGGIASFKEIAWNDGLGAVYGVAIGDLDGDGWPDIAAARSDAPNGIWFSGPVRK